MALSARKMAKVWGESAPALAQWAMQHAVTGSDSAMAYPPRKRASQGESPEAVVDTVDRASIQRHFSTKDPQDLVGIPTSAGNGDTKLMVIELESDAVTGLPTPGVLFQAALHWEERLRAVGFDLVIEACTPAGAFRIWALFDFPMEADRVTAFGRRITNDHTQLGLNHPPRIYPNPDDGQYLRLPGMHPLLDAWSLFWVVPEGTASGIWMEGRDAAETLMALKPVSGSLMREHLPPVVAESRGIEPTLTANGRQWLTANESEQARDLISKIDALHAPASAIITETDTKKSIPIDVDPKLIDPKHVDPNRDGMSKPERSPADTTLRSLSQRTGLTEEAIQKRLLDWLLQQDTDTQDTLLGLIPEGMQQTIAQLVLERMQARDRTDQAA